MPSKNNKNKKNQVNTNGRPEVKKAPEKKNGTSVVKPYFFDKTKIDFAFEEKKNVAEPTKDISSESSDKGFVSAHFYPTKSSQIPTPVTQVEKTDEITQAPTMKQLLSDNDNKNEAAEISDTQIDKVVPEKVIPVVTEEKVKSEEKKEVCENNGMKELFEKLPSDSENKNEATKEKAVPEKTHKAPAFVPTDSESRRENDAILSSLTPDDIKNKVDSKKKKGGVVAFFRFVAMAVCFVVLVISSFNLVSGFANKARDREKNEELRDAFNSGEIGYTSLGYAKKDTSFAPDERLYSDEGSIYKAPEPEVYDMHEKYERMLPNLQALKYVNSSAFAWIKVSGTRVDYPVVRSPQGDNDYYLSHGLDRTYSVSGAVFTDYKNSTKLSNNKNTCVYGHNMNDGTMFQTIMNFKEKNQFLNSTIEMYTAEGIYVYIPFAVYDALPTESFFKTEFETDEDFLWFLNDIKSKSLFTNKDVKLDKNSKVVTLITCTNTVTDKRFVVHGALKEVVK